VEEGPLHGGKLGETFPGYVTGVQAFGLFVELEEVYVQGLVHVSSMTDDYYRFDERAHRLKGESAGRSTAWATASRFRWPGWTSTGARSTSPSWTCSSGPGRGAPAPRAGAGRPGAGSREGPWAALNPARMPHPTTAASPGRRSRP
jgi:hypothetical protein